MTEQEKNDQQIKPEQFNMILLEFLINNPRTYWNINEIKEKASTKTLNYNRVKKSIYYFANKNFISKFLDLSLEEQKKEAQISSKEITLESYKINEHGKATYDKIMKSCLDPVGSRLLSFEKID